MPSIVGAVAVNAGISMAYGQDYRAAAQVKTVLKAIPADKSVRIKGLPEVEKAVHLAAAGGAGRPAGR